MEYLEHKAVWFPCAVRIAGLRIRPMTLGQLRLLEACNSPFVAGGDLCPGDIPLALLVLRLPWRLGRRILGRQRIATTLCAMLAPRAARPGVVEDLGAFVRDSLWMPGEFIGPGQAAPAFQPATGLAIRLALRARQIGAIELHPFPLRSVWDLPLKSLHATGTAAAERDGREFDPREDPAQ